MHHPLLETAIITMALVLLPEMVNGQCCGTNNNNLMVDDMIQWDGPSIINKNITFNGTLLIENNISIIDSIVVIEGKAILLRGNGSLTVRNSIITSGENGSGFYMDLRGNSHFSNTTLEKCIDLENGYFGLYVDGNLLKAENLTMTRSGMIRMENANLEMTGSRIAGIMSFGGNISLTNTTVEYTGITQYGPGDIELSRVIIATNMSFTGTAGVSSGGDVLIRATDVLIKGTFNAGISIESGTLSLGNIIIDLEDGIHGITGKDSTILQAENISINGTDTGLEMNNCSQGLPLKDIRVNSTLAGFHIQGNAPIEIINSSISTAYYGISTNTPLTLRNVSFINNTVGILSDSISALDIAGCLFMNYRQWGIEEGGWNEITHNNNIFEPLATSLGKIAWWGWISIDVKGPDNIPVEGSEIELSSSMGSRFRVEGSDVGVIWRYIDLNASRIDVLYSLDVKWGNAKARVNFTPVKDLVIEVGLPLTDIQVERVDYNDGNAIATISCSGSKAKEVEIELILDGIVRTTIRLNLSEGERKEIHIDLPEMKEGPHLMEVRANSREEYSGMDGYLQENNNMTIEISIEKERSDGRIELLLMAMVLIATGLFILPIFAVRRK